MFDVVEVYSHSGRLGTGLFVIPVVGIVASSVLAVAYAYADVYIPLAGYVSFILTFAFAAGVGFAISHSAVMAKCRNTGFVYVAGFITSLLALYASWVAFAYVLLRRELSSDMDITIWGMFAEPGRIWELACFLNEDGWYSISSWTPKGVALWILWSIEAVIVIGTITLIAGHEVSSRVFCERCERWCRPVNDMMHLMVTDNDDLMARIAGGNLVAMGELPIAPATTTPFFRIGMSRCDSCTDTATFRMQLVGHQQKKDGELEEQTTEIFGNRMLTAEQMKRLEALAARKPVDMPTSENENDQPSEERSDLTDAG